jgi:integrase
LAGDEAGLSPRGYRACLDASRHVKERWGDELANDLARHDVEAWLAGLPFGGSLKGKVLQCLSGAFKTFPALDNPCLGVRVRQEQKREARFLTVDELYELAEKVGAHYGSLVMFLGTTGVRIGECVALNVSDVDRARARVRVWKSRDRKSTKGSRARDVSAPPSVLDALDLERGRGEPLFVTERGSRVLVDNWRARVFTPAAESCGLDMTVHDLRHTAASLAIAAGADLKSVQQMLGHKTGQLTIDLYGHLYDKNLDAVAARMDAALASRQEQR